MNLRAALLENWPYKVAAIVLAVLLWLNVTADVERQDQGVATRLEVEVADPEWAIARVQNEVTTYFQGQRGDIIALLNQPVIRIVLENVEDSVVEVALNPADVEFDHSLEARATAVSPARVLVYLEPRESRTVPIIAVHDASTAEGLALGGLLVRPESVTVSGPRSAVSRITEIGTEVLEIGEISASITRLADLRLPPGVEGLTIDPDRVSVTFEVDSIVARRFQLTVTPEGPGAESVVLDPPVVRVTVEGPATAVSALEATDLGATVFVAEAAGAPRVLPVRVALPEGIDARAAAEPAEVTATPIGGGGE